jgi:glutamate racemase
VPLVEAGRLTGPEVEDAVRRSVAPLLGDKDGDGEFVFPLPPAAHIDTLLLGCTHYPLLLATLQRCVGEGVAIVDSATATASSLAELLSVNGLDAPASVATEAATHVQLTTGEVGAFRGTAERMFGEAFPDVQGIELEAGSA